MVHVPIPSQFVGGADGGQHSGRRGRHRSRRSSREVPPVGSGPSQASVVNVSISVESHLPSELTVTTTSSDGAVGGRLEVVTSPGSATPVVSVSESTNLSSVVVTTSSTMASPPVGSSQESSSV